MSYEDQKQKRIEELVKKKEIRQSKTELSIGFRWSVNVAIAFMPEDLRGTEKGFKFVEKWYQRFMEIDREYMMEHLSAPEPPKLTRQDFVEASKEAPEKQIVQRVADEISGEEKVADEKERETNKVDEINRGLTS